MKTRTNGMRTAMLRALALAVLAALAAPASALATPTIKHYRPSTPSKVTLDPSVAPAVHPNGRFFYVVTNDRLVDTVDAVTGRYLTSLDLGLDIGSELAAHPRTPMTISSDGSVLALPAAGLVRFFSLDRDGHLTPLSQYEAPTGAGMPVALSDDGSLAVVVSGPSGSVATVKTATGRELDSVPLSSSETPLYSIYSPRSLTVTVVTERNVLVFRHDESGKLKQRASYRRDTPASDAGAQVAIFGRRDRSVFTVEDTGRSLVGLNVRNGKEVARATPDSRDEFAAPIAIAPDGNTIVVTAVRPGTDEATALYVYATKGRGLSKDRPKRIDLPTDLGPLAGLYFDPAGDTLLAVFRASQTLVLIDPAAREVLDTTAAVGSPGGVTWAPDGRALYVAGSPTSATIEAAGSAAVTVLPVVRGSFSEQGKLVFSQLPGTLFGPGDHAFTFASKSYAIATSGAADRLYSFFHESLQPIAELDLGPSTGFLAVSPDGHILVVSANGGLQVVTLADTGSLTPVAPATPGAIPDDLSPSIAFDPTRGFAFVTAGNAVWRVNLKTGVSTPFTFGDAGTKLTNPVVDALGQRLYAIQDGTTLLRLAIGEGAELSRVNAILLDATLDAKAPRVAYDAGGSRLFVPDGDVVREYDTLFGVQLGVSQARPIGKNLVLVAPGLLAALPDAPGPAVLFDVTGSAPVYSGEIDMPAAPFAPLHGGTAAVDPATRTLFVPFTGARQVASASVDGDVVTVDGGTATAHVSVVPSERRLAYADMAAFPGSIVVTTDR